MITTLLFLTVLSTPGPAVGSPTPAATAAPSPYDAPPSCKDDCTITFNGCINRGSDVQQCLNEQTDCYNRCDGLGGSGGRKPGVMHRSM